MKLIAVLTRSALVLAMGLGLALVPAVAGATISGTIKLTAPTTQPVLRGDQITLAGTFSKAAGRALQVQRARTTSSTWTTIVRTKLTSAGAYTAKYTPSATYRYRAVLPATSTTSTRYSGTLTVTVVSGWRSISAGGEHTCGIWWDRSAWCWGSNAYGALGNSRNFDTSDPVTSPVRVSSPVSGARWASLVSGQSHTCGVLTTGSGWCWGDNSDGNLGIGSGTGASATPRRVSTASGSVWKRIVAGYSYTCGIRSDDTLWCWGFNSYGQAGFDSAGASVLSPHQVTLPVVSKQTWKTLALGYSTACGLRWNSTLWCWGDNTFLQRANPDKSQDPAPAMVNGPEGTWVSVIAGGFHTCGVLYNRQTTCWGDDGYGQLGASGFSGGGSSDLLQIDPPFDGAAGSVVAGEEHTCGLASDRTAWCWGRNQYGQLGIAAHAGDPTTPQTSPAKIGTSHWLRLSAAEEHTCAIRIDHTAWCWGNNDGGRLSGATGADVDGPNWSPRKVPSP